MPDESGFQLEAAISFALYTGAVFALAFFSHLLLKKKAFLKEYFIGSRGLGLWALAMSYAATSSSGGSFTGFPALIYTQGWIMALWIASYMVVPICCMGMLGKRINQVINAGTFVKISFTGVNAAEILDDSNNMKTAGTITWGANDFYCFVFNGTDWLQMGDN